VNETRLKIFQQKYKPTNPESPLEKIKDLEQASPCKNVLVQRCGISLEASTSKRSTREHSTHRSWLERYAMLSETMEHPT
jgi:hypothetical protein